MPKLKDDFENIETSQNQVSHWPRICRQGECKNDTDVAMLVVRDDKGNKRIGTFSQFGHVKKAGYAGGKDQWLLHDGWSFVRWETFCSECWHAEVNKQGTAQQLQPGKTE